MLKDLDIFERVRIRLGVGKDFSPEMVYELCQAYDKRIAELETAQQGVQRTCPDCGGELYTLERCIKCHHMQAVSR